MYAPRMSLSPCFSSTPANSSLCLADVEKGWEKRSKRASPFGAEQLCNRFPPCPCGTTHQAGPPCPPPPPRLSAHKGRGLPRDPVAVEELQGASPYSGADSTWWASQPAIFVLCLSVCLSPADEPLSRQKKPRKPCLAPSQLATQCAIGIAGAV